MLPQKIESSKRFCKRISKIPPMISEKTVGNYMHEMHINSIPKIKELLKNLEKRLLIASSD